MATYYVSTTGSDSSGDGSISTPWSTIDYAQDQLSAGDTLYVRAGTYHQSVTITCAGTSGNEITIANYPGESVTLDGEYTLPSGGVASQYTKMINDPTVSANVKNNSSPWTWSALLILSDTASYVIWDGIDLYRSYGRGIQTGGSSNNCTVKNVEIRSCRHAGIQNFGTDHTYEDCIITDCANFCTVYRGSGEFNHPGIVGFNPSQNNITYTRLHIYRNYGEGLMIGKNTVVDGCVIWDNMYDNVYVNKSNDSIIKNCLIYATPDTRYYRGSSPSKGIWFNNEREPANEQTNTCDVFNNIIINTRFGINFTKGESSDAEFNNINIFNNTIVGTAANGMEVGVQWGTPGGGYSGCNFKNNIILHDSNVAAGYGKSGWTFSNNCWRTDPSGGSESGRVIADPNLKNASATLVGGSVQKNNYTLNVDSLCIDAGTTISSPEVDTAGNAAKDTFGSTRSGTWDIGAHEYGGGSTPAGTITAAFSASATTGNVSLTVQFTDASTATAGVDAWEWYYKEAADSDYTGFSDFAAENPIQTFGPGTYTIKLVVSGDDGTDSEIKTSYIVVSASTGGGTTGGGGADTDPPFYFARTTTPSSTGTDAISFDGMTATPPVVLLMASQATADDTAADDAVISISAGIDNSNETGISASAEHGVGTTNTNRRGANSRSAIIVDPDGTGRQGDAENSSMSAGTATLNWAYVPASLLKLTALAIMADDVAIGYATVPSSPTAVNVGFEPDVVISWTQLASIGSSGAEARWNVGIAVNGGNAYSAGIAWTDAAAAGAGNGRIDSVALAAVKDNGGTYYTLTYGSWTSTGWTTTLASGSASGEYGYLALRWDNRNVSVDVFSTPTSTGSGTGKSGYGWRPGGLLALATLCSSIDADHTDAEGGGIGIGAYAGGTQWSHSVNNEYGADPTNTQSYTTAALIGLPDDDGGAGLDISVASIDNDAWYYQADSVLGTARKVIVLAIETAAEETGIDWLQYGEEYGARYGLP